MTDNQCLDKCWKHVHLDLIHSCFTVHMYSMILTTDSRYHVLFVPTDQCFRRHISITLWRFLWAWRFFVSVSSWLQLIEHRKSHNTAYQVYRALYTLLTWIHLLWEYPRATVYRSRVIASLTTPSPTSLSAISVPYTIVCLHQNRNRLRKVRCFE